jgi:tRNA A-37 threonylcarbamoyl transferase component Bud32
MAIRFKGNADLKKITEKALKGKVPIGSIVRKQNHKQTFQVNLPNGQTVFLKIFGTKKGLVKKIRGFVKKPYARREFDSIKEVQNRGFKTAELLAVGSKRFFNFNNRSVLITKKAEGKTVNKFLSLASKKEKQQVIVAFAKFVRSLHQSGVRHSDLKLDHIFIKKTKNAFEFTLIDFESTRFMKPEKINLMKEFDSTIINTLAKYPQFSLKDFLIFYKNYFGIEKLAEKDKSLVRKLFEKAKNAKSSY